ncbi:MAG: hypothetical protein WC371_05215 [Parachlamydiales bacterium]|jgi:hypothetical protein
MTGSVTPPDSTSSSSTGSTSGSTPDESAFSAAQTTSGSFESQLCRHFGWDPEGTIQVYDEETGSYTTMTNLEAAKSMVNQLEMSMYRYMKNVFEKSRERQKEAFRESQS